MPTKPNLPADAAALRRRAEARLSEQRPETEPAQAEAETRRLVHELQVHQVELEMQNEELQQARAELEAGLEKYTDLYDFAPVGYLTLDREGTIREANLASGRLLGIERSRLVQRRFGLSVCAVDLPVFNALLARAFQSQTRECCEVTLLKEGTPAIEARLEAVAAASGQDCRVAVLDVTERKQAEADRLVLGKLESTGILAGGIAHDFNNLLTAILLNVDLAQALCPPGQESACLLGEVKKAAFMARDLTRQLLTFASGGAPVRKPTLLSAVIQDAVPPSLSGSRVRSEFSLAGNLWPAEVDAAQIGQVLRNLVLNAREAMPEGGIISIRAENLVLGPQGPASPTPGDYVRLSVADRGGGIPKEVLPKIFDPYFSTKQRGTQKGMGLGLTICHMVIRNHGGTIAVESEVGRGTTFHIYLPACRARLPEEKGPGQTFLPRHGRLLVMDDEEGVRNVVGTSLQRMGHEVELVADGQKAVEVYLTAKGLGRPFDAVLLDLTVRGGIGGQQVVQALLKIDPDVKAIVMSGYSSDPVLLDPQSYGFQGVVAKPFDRAKLQEILTRILGPEQVTTHE